MKLPIAPILQSYFESFARLHIFFFLTKTDEKLWSLFLQEFKWNSYSESEEESVHSRYSLSYYFCDSKLSHSVNIY